MVSKPLLICGFPSGGTDLIKTVLNAHPDIHISGEMPWLKDVAARGYDHSTVFSDIDVIHEFQNLLQSLDFWHNVGNVSHDFTENLREKGALSLEEVTQICFTGRDVKIWGNKTPQNTENIATLSQLFPNARFLIITRDIRDICLSWNKKWGKDMIWCAAKWAERMAIGKRVTDTFPKDRYLYVKFEDLLSDSEKTCAEICEFCDLPFSNNMLEHHKSIKSKIDGKINYGEPIKADNKNKWKKSLSVKTTQRIEEIAFDTMPTFDYHIEYATRKRPASYWEILRGKIKDVFALLFIGNRSSQNNTFTGRVKDTLDAIKRSL